jgi:hypothetical protein
VSEAMREQAASPEGPTGHSSAIPSPRVTGRWGRRDPSPALHADWRTGPRTPAWDALWRLIFEEIQLDDEAADAPTAPSECAHGEGSFADTDTRTEASSPSESQRPA